MRYLIPVFLLTACTTPPPPDVPEEVPIGAAQGLPTLRLEAEVNVPELEDLSRFSQVAVSAQGSLLFANQQESQVLRVRHLDGSTLAFGPKGEGPGEVNEAMFLFVNDTAVVFRDPSQSRISWFGLDGRPLKSARVRMPGVNTSASAGEGQVVFGWGAGSSREVVRIDASTGATSAIDLSADSLVVAQWGGPGRQVRPTPGPWYGGFLLADARSYTIGFYDWDGNRVAVYQQPGDRPNLPTAEEVERQARNLQLSGSPMSPGRRSQLLNREQPWFANTIRQDGAGRTWVVATRFGRSEADVFLGPTFLGSLPLPCEALGPRWDLAGSWLAVICEPDDPGSTADAVVKLFEIQ